MARLFTSMFAAAEPDLSVAGEPDLSPDASVDLALLTESAIEEFAATQASDQHDLAASWEVASEAGTVDIVHAESEEAEKLASTMVKATLEAALADIEHSGSAPPRQASGWLVLSIASFALLLGMWTFSTLTSGLGTSPQHAVPSPSKSQSFVDASQDLYVDASHSFGDLYFDARQDLANATGPLPSALVNAIVDGASKGAVTGVTVGIFLPWAWPVEAAFGAVTGGVVGALTVLV